MAKKLQIVDYGQDILLAQKGKRQLRYIYAQGQWQELFSGTWEDISHDELMSPRHEITAK